MPLVSPRGETINPDLGFGDPIEAIGDVKYKEAGPIWDRPDTYEVVAFAEAARTTRGSIVDFTSGSTRRPDITIGGISVRHLGWDVWRTPAEAGERLVADAEDWLGSAEAEACEGAA